MTTAQETLFNEHGRRVPFEGMRVFSQVSRGYYQLKQPDFNFETVLKRMRQHAGLADKVTATQFESACAQLKKAAKAEGPLGELFKGVNVPFICPKAEGEADLGEEFESRWLAAVKNSFTKTYPPYHFKSTLQGAASDMAGKLKVAAGSRYEGFLQARRQGAVAGWYFPAALLEYDIESQRRQMESLPLRDKLMLSGGFDAAAALVGSPDLLRNGDVYPPILCVSAFEHTDPRLMLCFKAYGLSLEFWLLGQMLIPGVTQVSEQWAGGLTLYTVLR